jgi:hypothetical protein
MVYDPATGDFQQFLENIWQVFASHQQLKPNAIKLQSYLPQHDILRLMAEEIDLQDWRGKLTVS